MPRVLINGFGRVGRALYRLLQGRKGVEVARINDPLPADQLAYLLKYDTVMGRFPGTVRSEGEVLFAGEARTPLSHRDTLTHAEVEGCDIVINSSGRNNTRKSLESLLGLGAGRVIVSKPLPREVCDRTILRGINDAALHPTDRILSAGSCTAHCYAPIMQLLQAKWPIQRGFMMTVHAYTSAQNLVDGGHDRDPRRGRAAAANIVPTTTESLEAFEQALPELAGRINGMAQRVPVVNGSNVELVLELKGEATADELNQHIKAGAEGKYQGIIEYSEDALVSSDIVGNQASAIHDAQLTSAKAAKGSTLTRLVAWYDNEWGYTNRLAELIDLAARQTK